MNKTLRQFFVASAIGVASLGSHAQSPSVMPLTPASPETAQTQAERDYEAAKAACDAQRFRTAKIECLRNAEDDYRATGTSPGGGKNGAGGPAGTGQAAPLEAEVQANNPLNSSIRFGGRY